MNNMFSDNIKQVLNLSRDEAKRLGHTFIGTEHLLLGIIRHQDCSAHNLFHKLNVDLDLLQQSIEDFVSTSGSDTASQELPFTPRAKQMLTDAVEEAKAQEKRIVGTTHLLLALAQDTAGIAGMVLDKSGYTYKTLKETLGNT